MPEQTEAMRRSSRGRLLGNCFAQGSELLDIQIEEIIVQLALLLRFRVLQRFDLFPQGRQIGLLLVEFFHVARVEFGAHVEPGHVLADAGLLLRDFAGALLAARALGAGLVQAVAHGSYFLKRFLHTSADLLSAQIDGDSIIRRIDQSGSLRDLSLLADDELRQLIRLDRHGEPVNVTRTLGFFLRLDHLPVAAERVLDQNGLLLLITVANVVGFLLREFPRGDKDPLADDYSEKIIAASP